MSERAVFTWIRIGLAIGGIFLLVEPIVLMSGLGNGREQAWFRGFAALLLLLAAIPYGRPPAKDDSDEGSEEL